MRFYNRALHAFVAARFWIAPAVIILYYIQRYVFTHLASLPFRSVMDGTHDAILILLVLVFLTAIAANPLWVADYRSRLIGGIESMRKQTGPVATASEILEQMRWSSTKMLGVVTVILAVVGQYESLIKIPPEHRVPAITLALLVLVSLFDAALDLEAEWTITVLSAITLLPAAEAGLPKVIWETNQFRQAQKALVHRLASKQTITDLGVDEFTGAAKNIIAFAIVLISCMAAYATVLLVREM